jgi:NTP pyrophosphatase (non-canonical NTP hydrolase)
VRFLTAQPESWRKYTSKWLEDRFPGCSVIYVHKPKEKLALVRSFDGLLIEDYPFFDDYKDIVLIDRPYNRKVNCARISSIQEFLTTIVMAYVWDVGNLVDLCYGIAKSKGWWDTERNDGEMVALMHSELSEALEALRSSNGKKDHVGEELVDCCIRIFDYCGGRDITFTRCLAEKIVKNLGRPYKHGKKF